MAKYKCPICGFIFDEEAEGKTIDEIGIFVRSVNIRPQILNSLKNHQMSQLKQTNLTKLNRLKLNRKTKLTFHTPENMSDTIKQ